MFADYNSKAIPDSTAQHPCTVIETKRSIDYKMISNSNRPTQDVGLCFLKLLSVIITYNCPWRYKRKNIESIAIGISCLRD